MSPAFSTNHWKKHYICPNNCTYPLTSTWQWYILQTSNEINASAKVIEQKPILTLEKLEGQVGQESLTCIRLIICHTVPWWPSWLSDQIAISNPESDVVWRVSRLPSWPPSWILELNDLAILNLPDASHQVSVQYDSQFGRRCGLNFKMATILDIGTEWF